MLRPSIIAASFEEPAPGWTDSVKLLGGFYAIAGYGGLKDLPINPKLIGDQIPVDFVCNQLLAALPVCVMNSRTQGAQDTVMITHSCSSSSNGFTWGETIHALEEHWQADPFDGALRTPALRAHSSQRSYKTAFKLYNEVPSRGWYYVTRILGTKKQHSSAKEYLNYVQ